MSRWDCDQIGDHLAKYTHGSPWNEFKIGKNWNKLCRTVLSDKGWNGDFKAKLWSLIGGEV